MKLDQNCPPLVEVIRRVSYDAEKGIFRASVSSGKRKAGDVCGYADQAGYVKLSIMGKWVMAHRLAWRLHHGEWPDGEIDHINGNPSDNRICNLRVATRSQNMMNTRRGNGVCWHKVRKKWQVLIKAGGKSHYIGSFECRRAADIAAREAIARLHGEFAQFQPAAPQPVQTAMFGDPA